MYDTDDIMVWADGTWCYSSELTDMSFMSDDYTVLRFDTDAYNTFLNTVGPQATGHHSLES